MIAKLGLYIYIYIKKYYWFKPVGVTMGGGGACPPPIHTIDWCNKGRGMYYPVCGMMHIEEPLLLIEKSSLCGGSGFISYYLSGPLPYVRRHITVNKCVECVVK